MNVGLISANLFPQPPLFAAHPFQDVTRTGILPEEKVVPLVNQTQQAEIEDLKFAKKDLLAFSESLGDELHFAVDERGRTVIRSVDRETNQIVRQVSPTEVLIARFEGNVVGHLVDMFA